MKKINLPFGTLAALLLLSGCTPPMVMGLAAGGGMYATKPGEGAPADTEDQIAPHESWCYHTLGEEVECFSEPQDTPPGRLVNVDPANRYPLNRKAYADALAKAHAPTPAAAATAAEDLNKPAQNPDAMMIGTGALTPAAVMPATVSPAPMSIVPKAAAPAPAHKKVVHHHHKTPKKTTKPAKPAVTSTAKAPPAIPNPTSVPPLDADPTK